MIVKWNEARVKVIPNGEGRPVKLLPGHNEVAPKDWKGARENVLTDIASGRIVEVAAVIEEVATKDADGKASGKKSVIKGATPFKDLEPEEALRIIRETFSIETLEAWRKSSAKDELRAAIAEQIALVNTKRAPGSEK